MPGAQLLVIRSDADPVTNLLSIGSVNDVKAMLMRVIDYLKLNEVTALFTSLTPGKVEMEQTETGVSSLMDTWISLVQLESNGERNRLMFVIKSRGSAHSNQVREFVLTDQGPELVDVFVGPEGVVTGTARMAEIERERSARAAHAVESERRRLALARRTTSLEAQIADLQSQLAAESTEFDLFASDQDAGAAQGAAARR